MEGVEQYSVSEQTLKADVTKNGAESGKSRARGTAGLEKPARAEAIEVVPREPVEINLKSLLEAGVHFGHQTSRWHPAMAEYIYTSRNGIHIINLPKTIQSWAKAREAIVSIAARGGKVLFVGTKKQAQKAIIEEAKRCGAFYVSHRWLGGMLTNFQTIRKSISRMKKVEAILQEEELAIASGEPTKYKKKERLMMTKELEKLEYSLGGIRNMHSHPQLIFVVDIKREDISIKEAKRLDVPVVGLVDTNCNPAEVEYPIPSNDDGTRAIRLFCAAIADAIIEGREVYKIKPPAPEEELAVVEPPAEDSEVRVIPPEFAAKFAKESDE